MPPFKQFSWGHAFREAERWVGDCSGCCGGLLLPVVVPTSVRLVVIGGILVVVVRVLGIAGLGFAVVLGVVVGSCSGVGVVVVGRQ